VENEKVKGVITRTDLLQILTGDKVRQPDPLFEKTRQKRNIASLMKEKLQGRLLDTLIAAGETGAKMGFQAYVVGGFVRDLILRVPNQDIDLVIEGDGIKFAREFAKKFGARMRSHKKFKTAVVIFPDGFKVDVATARWEYYEYPAAMPTVALSSIKLDLYRRDFSINTLAVKLNSGEFGTIIDFFGGQRDIKDRIIRVLHSLSFVEDPTRVFRAIRFEQRFKFRIGKHTLKLIKNAKALNLFSKISGKRLSTELRLMLSESDPRSAIERCAELDLLKVIHPAIVFGPGIKKALSMTHDVLTWYDLLYKPQRPKKWIVYLLSLTSNLNETETRELMKRLSHTGSIKRLFIEELPFAKKAAQELEGRPHMKPSEIYLVLKSIPLELLLFIQANTKSDKVKKAVSRFITEFRGKKPRVSGKDLEKMGFPQGPLYTTILNRLLEACLNGEVRKKKEEIELIKREFGDILPANSKI
jgi:tRNA nucleotidyltransferase (CCA-adding enzyme)